MVVWLQVKIRGRGRSLQPVHACSVCDTKMPLQLQLQLVTYIQVLQMPQHLPVHSLVQRVLHFLWIQYVFNVLAIIQVYGHNDDKSKMTTGQNGDTKTVTDMTIFKTATNPNNTYSYSEAYIQSTVGCIHIYGMQRLSYMKNVQYSITCNA